MKKSTNQYCTFYIVRHGETDWNKQGLIQGHTDTPLNEHGRQQALSLSKEFHRLSFDQVFSSDLQRARETAEILAAEHALPVQTTALLREKKLGYVEGQHISELAKIDAIFHALSDEEKKTYKYSENAETEAEAIGRFITFFRDVSLRSPGKRMLVVTHGGVLKRLLIHTGFFDFATARQHSIGNTGYVRLVSDGADFFVEETHGIVTVDILP